MPQATIDAARLAAVQDVPLDPELVERFRRITTGKSRQEVSR